MRLKFWLGKVSGCHARLKGRSSEVNIGMGGIVDEINMAPCYVDLSLSPVSPDYATMEQHTKCGVDYIVANVSNQHNYMLIEKYF